jgi:hypothetical protein
MHSRAEKIPVEPCLEFRLRKYIATVAFFVCFFADVSPYSCYELI